jgi:hypothetical protein
LGFVGEIDSKRFPYVVLIKSDIGWCTGVASSSGLIATAAHCVWSSEGRYATNLTVSLQTPEQETSVAKIFVSDAYKAASARWNALSHAQDSTAEQAFHKMSLEDTAFLVTTENLDIPGYPLWITDLLSTPFSSLGEAYGRWGNTWVGTVGEQLIKVLSREVGPAPQMALGVGYGNFSCKNFTDREHNCILDSQRRFGEIPISRSEWSADPNAFAPPWLWCTGRNTSTINPIQHGDSGGPIFIETNFGEWLFVGFTSGGNFLESCASSIVRNFDLYLRANFEEDEYRDHVPLTNKEALPRLARGIRNFLRQYIETWNAPPKFISKRMRRYFDYSVTINGQEMTQTAVRQAKEKFAQDCSREFVAAAADNAKFEDLAQFSLTYVDVDIPWTVRCENRPEATGITTFRFRILDGGSGGGPVFRGRPRIVEESLIGGDQLPEAWP